MISRRSGCIACTQTAVSLSQVNFPGVTAQESPSLARDLLGRARRKSCQYAKHSTAPKETGVVPALLQSSGIERVAGHCEYTQPECRSRCDTIFYATSS